jgi:RpiB/LacA/LacB family sugar-phosphate isomerase
MRIAIGADHQGFELKEQVAGFVRDAGHEVLDVGTFGRDPVDYPDFAVAVGEAVLAGRAERGILVCGSGVGAAVAANKLPGVRAGLCHDTYAAHQGVEHDDMNVLVLGGLIIGRELARELVRVFLAARFDGLARHQRRLDKIRALEERGASGSAARSRG